MARPKKAKKTDEQPIEEGTKKKGLSKADFLKKYKDDIRKAEVDDPNICLTTGSPRVDILIGGGGWRRGTISEAYGPPGSGKSSLYLSTAAKVLENSGSVAWFDEEGALDIGIKGELSSDQKKTRSWLIKNGIDPEHPDFQIFDWLTAEELFERVQDIIENGLYDLVVVDSIAGFKTRAEIEGEIGDAHYGAMAKVLSNGLPRWLRGFKVCRKAGHNMPHIGLINQVRDKIGSMFGGQKSTGGNALPHFGNYKLKIARMGDSVQGREIVQSTKVKIEKCRFAPKRETEIQISSECGVDASWEILEFLKKSGRCQAAGAFNYFYDRPVTAEEFKEMRAEKTHAKPDNGCLYVARGEAEAKNYVKGNDMGTFLTAMANLGDEILS